MSAENAIILIQVLPCDKQDHGRLTSMAAINVLNQTDVPIWSLSANPIMSKQISQAREDNDLK